MRETRAIEVHPSETEQTINVYESFGWTLTACESISTGSISGTSGGSISHSADKLIFVRDTEMNNYDKLNSLFNEYMSYHNQLQKMDKNNNSDDNLFAGIVGVSTGFGLIFVVLILHGMFFRNTMDGDLILLGGILSSIFIGVLVGAVSAYFRKNDYDRSVARSEKRNEIIEKMNQIREDAIGYQQ